MHCRVICVVTWSLLVPMLLLVSKQEMNKRRKNSWYSCWKRCKNQFLLSFLLHKWSPSWGSCCCSIIPSWWGYPKSLNQTLTVVMIFSEGCAWFGALWLVPNIEDTVILILWTAERETGLPDIAVVGFIRWWQWTWWLWCSDIIVAVL